ncbi:putative centromeric dna binding protein [Lyophyllum shimeji]|uniref:CENP-C homolog n=1 Tax=Lyophyllum shimeji TaxID=47721 RepID=A0A9P3PFF9_LYOSH|nr:putative centromeric dna binding protein [Lyophyllum shimeji]
MSTASRKSSVGAARRGPQKAHIPYRGDNPEVGKKTGIAVRHVERKSDGFEPFEELIQQADKRTPPKPKARKKKQSMIPAVEEEFDEYGEMSMELDDSPVQYFANSRQPMSPASYRNGISSRPVGRTSDIDFDQVPSPRPRGNVRKSTGPGPSRLSRSFHAQDLQQDSEEDEAGAADGGLSHYEDQDGDYNRDVSPEGTSFVQMDQDDDEEEEQEVTHNGIPHEEPEEETPPPPTRRDKGKGRAPLPDVPEERESEVEDEIANGLDNNHYQQYSDEDGPNEQQEPELSPRRAKKAKFAEDRQRLKTRPLGKSKKENRVYREGVRKSAREHYKPLEWWRGEKLVYGRSQRSGSGLVLVPPIREIVRIPKEEPEPLGKRKRSRARSKSKVPEEVQIKVVPVENPEDGWDDKTDAHCVVIDYDTKTEVERRVAYTANMLQPRKVPSDNWMFEKVFGDAGFIAAGVLIIPKNGRKPTKQTKDNTYIFYVVEGAVNLKIHETSLILATGAMFIVPRGNSYFIENVAERDSKLFFTQARKVVELPEPAASGSHIEPSRRPSVSAGTASIPPAPPPPARSSSAGAAKVEGQRAMSKVAAPKRAASTRA